MDKLYALEFRQQLEGLGVNFGSLTRYKGVLAGQAVYEFFLYKKGILPFCNLHSFEVYSDGASMGRKGEILQAHLDTEYKFHKAEDIQALFDRKYPLNFEQVAFFKDAFVYSKEFENLVNTRQVKVTYHKGSDYEIVCKLLKAVDRYQNKLFFHLEKELHKVSITTSYSVGASSKYISTYSANKEYLDKFFTCRFDGNLFLRGNKASQEKFAPKEVGRFPDFKKHIFDFWDEIYGGASKLRTHNYQLLKGFGLEHLFEKEAYNQLKKQLASSDIQLLKKYLKMHNLEFLVEKEDIDKTIEKFSYLKLLVEDYGTWVLGVVETSKNPNLESVHGEIMQDYHHSHKPLVKPLKLSKFIEKCKAKNYIVKELTTRQELLSEGDTMHHCVGGYSNSVASGLSKIFSLRKGGRERSTLELRRQLLGREWFVNQNKSFHNASPSKSLLSLGMFLCKYINKMDARSREKALQSST